MNNSPRIELPKDLIDALCVGEAVAVIGSGPSIDAGLPSWPRLIELMISECRQQLVEFSDADELKKMLEAGELMDVADECSRLLQGHLYRDFMQRTLRPLEVRPIDTHSRILDLPFCAILTTNYDCLLENAYVLTSRTAGIPPVYTQKNVAQLARLITDKQFFILKVHGHIDDVETLVLTHTDYRTIMQKHPAYQAALSTLFATRTAVFIGYGLKDHDLRMVLEYQASVFQGFGRRHYALVANPSHIIKRILLKKYNIVAIPYDGRDNHAELKDILAEIKNRIEGVSGTEIESGTPRPLATPSQRTPYKFLDHYDFSDKDFFFGREKDTQAVMSSMLAHRLTILFGSSGRGKTSLLRASIVPGLCALGHTVIECRFSPTPLQALAAAFDKCLTQKGTDSVRTPREHVEVILAGLHDRQGAICFVFDQFEDLFSYGDEDCIEAVALLLQTIALDSTEEYHCIISIRKDHFARLHDLKSTIPGIFNNCYELGPLSRASAQAAIIGPAEFVGLCCETDYVQSVLDDIGESHIEPPHLQIVCTAVYNALPVNVRSISRDLYFALGTAKAILSEYIPQVLRSFRPSEREIAKDVLKILVTTAHQRAQVPLPDILGYAHRNVSDVLSVIETLVYHRLVRIAEGNEEVRYEISHDYLVSQVDKWISDEEREIRRVREVMANERRICDSLGTVIDVERARFLDMYRDVAGYNDDDIKLISRSIVHWTAAEQKKASLDAEMRLSQRIEAESRLVGGIAHDFNNIVQVISGHAEILGELVRADGASLAHVDAIVKVAGHASSLIRQMLLFVHRTELPRAVVDVNEILSGFMDVMTRMIGADIKLETDLCAPPPTIETEGGMIEQVVMNLVMNARDAMPHGGTIVVSSDIVKEDCDYIFRHPEYSGKKYISISVRDTGCGMDDDTRRQVFEPFFTTKSKDKGTGLGLATVYGIVCKHGGWVEVDSQIGRGSTFTVCLPASQASVVSLDAFDARNDKLPGDGTILLAEDEESMRNMVNLYLIQHGFTVLCAGNGSEAYSLWKANRSIVSLIFTDIIMPEMSGIDLVMQIRQECPEIGVLYCSGYSQHLVFRGEQLIEGVNYLTKPYKFGYMVATIRSILNQSMKYE